MNAECRMRCPKSLTLRHIIESFGISIFRTNWSQAPSACCQRHLSRICYCYHALLHLDAVFWYKDNLNLLFEAHLDCEFQNIDCQMGLNYDYIRYISVVECKSNPATQNCQNIGMGTHIQLFAVLLWRKNIICTIDNCSNSPTSLIYR